MSDQQSAGTPAEDVYAEDESSPAAEELGADTATAVAEPPVDKPLFSDDERAQFDADDVQAGGAIGKMLAIFFLYTVFAMSIVAWWTFRAAG